MTSKIEDIDGAVCLRCAHMVPVLCPAVFASSRPLIMPRNSFLKRLKSHGSVAVFKCILCRSCALTILIVHS